MAYDTATGEMVLFGGESAGGSFLTDTWTYNDSTWTQQHPATSPPPSLGPSMAYDPGTSETVLFGGDDNGLFLNKTWAYNGSTWTEQHPAASPSARYGASMAYASATGKMVLFGGFGKSGSSYAYLADTWTYNGSTWTEQHPAKSPPAFEEGSIAYDSATGEIVLFGGRNGSGYFAATWTYNGSTWTEQHPAESPQDRLGASMAYDSAKGEIVLFGGGSESGHILNKTWTYNGSTWTEQDPAESPLGRHSASMAYDSVTGKMVLFGGFGENNSYLADTWTFGPKASPVLSTSASAGVVVGGVVHDEALLSGGSLPGGSITFSLYGPDDESCANAPVYTSPPVTVSNDGSYESGEYTPWTPGVYRWVASYSGDNGNEATAGTCGETGETVTVSKASPSLSTSASVGAVVGGKVHDQASLSGGSSPGGSIVFKLYDPTDTGCTGTPTYTSPPVTVSNNGSYESGEYTPLTPGVYRWIASYSGDSNNEATAGTCGETGETMTVSKASPSLPTTASAGVVLGGKVHDEALLSNGSSPSGTIVFKLYDSTDTDCTGTPAYTSPPVTASGDGGYESGEYIPSTSGVYRWIASYSGDSNNEAIAGTCGETGESVTVSKASPSLSTNASTDVAVGGGDS